MKIHSSYLNNKDNRSLLHYCNNSIIWLKISCFENLSEDFIKEFKDKVDWYIISHYQNLSESFVEEFKDKIHWYILLKLNNYIPKELKDKYKNN
jgi:hypothetical protein